MIDLIEGLPDGVVGLKAHGEVTSEDYKKVLEPAIAGALTNHDKVRMLYVFGSEVTGMSAGAMWQDSKVGVGHYTKFERVAVVTDKDWLRHSVDVFGYLIPGEIKGFSMAEEAQARAWICS